MTSNAARFSDALAQVAEVDGWMSDDQAERLWAAASRVPSGGRIVEIGSFRGRSTIILATAAAEGAEVVAIDPHAGNDRGPQEIEGYVDEAEVDHETFLANLAAAGVGDRVRHVRAFSDAAHGDVEGDIDVLYIDGAHRFGPARADVRDWGARVVPGGTMLIHDAFSSIGVTGAIAAELLASGDWTYVGRSRSLVEYARTAPSSRVGNVASQLAQLPWFVRNVIIKVLIVAKLGRLTRFLGHDGDNWPY